jgi:hypothetical protein
MTTLITNKDGTTYETTIAQVVFKGCELKPIGKTGYFSEKIPASGPSQGKSPHRLSIDCAVQITRLLINIYQWQV